MDEIYLEATVSIKNTPDRQTNVSYSEKDK